MYENFSLLHSVTPMVGVGLTAQSLATGGLEQLRFTLYRKLYRN